MNSERTYKIWAKLWWQKWAEGAQATGPITADELRDWLDDLQSRDQAGKFFATWAGIFVSATKPQAANQRFSAS